MRIKRNFKFSLFILLILIFLSSPLMAQDSTLKSSAEDNALSQQQDESFPSSYDLRNLNGKNYVTPVKNQKPFGTCWAHAAISCCETNSILKGGSSNIDLSEKSLAWNTYQFQGPFDAPDEELEGIFNTTFDFIRPQGYNYLSSVYNNGSHSAITAPSQLSSWLGASTEEQVPYVNSFGDYVDVDGQTIASELGDWSLDYYDIYDNAFHLQNAEVVNGTFNNNTGSIEEYVSKTKSLMLENGSVTITYYAVLNSQEPEPNELINEETSAQYCPTDIRQASNHAVTVVGWDDNYSKDNFVIEPPGDGAWIIKNSWGPEWGDNGYFYLSYYDATIGEVASLDIETPELGYSYDHNYQYDYAGDKYNLTYYGVRMFSLEFVDSEPPVNPDQYAFANVFTSEGNELLKAVSAYTVVPDTEVTASVYLLNDNYTSPVDGELVATVSKSLTNAGFYTLTLDTPVNLAPGQKFSVVENMSYEFVRGDQSIQIPFYSLEYGSQDLSVSSLTDEYGQEIGETFIDIRATANEGESYVCGLNDETDPSSNPWQDITDPEVMSQLTVETFLGSFDSGYDILKPGNCMIKAYTSENTPGVIMPSGIQFDSGSVYLTTDELGQNSVELTASVIPSNAENTISYSIYPSTVASLTQDGNTAKVTAVSEGQAKLVAKSINGYVATKDITVSDKSFIVGDVVTMTNQDYLEIEIDNLIANPALDQNIEPDSVSVFVWSDNDMSDVQALPAKRAGNSNIWITDAFGINNTLKYLDKASSIKYVVYIGNKDNSLANMVFSGFTSWVDPGIEEQGEISYISYNQNIGFVEPTVHEGSSGVIGDPNSVHMEGLRVSSGIPGVNIITTVHAAGLGWLSPVADGQYAGTMHENRALEAIQLSLEDDDPENLYSINYRVYVKDSGWTNWVSEGEVAGTTGQSLPIQAVDIRMVINSSPEEES